MGNMAAGTYYWHVRTQDNAGNWSAWSTAANFIVELTPPTVPSSLKQVVTGNSVAFNWTAAKDASGIRQYQLQVDNNADFSSPEYSATPAANTANVDNMVTGAYYWKVRSQDNSGNWSNWSKSSSFVVVPTDAAANTRLAAQDIDAGVDNWVGFGDAADFYKLTMTDAGTLTLGLTGLSGNADLALLNSSGIALKTSAKTGTTDESIANVPLLAGTYYVKVAAGYGVNDADYTLTYARKYYPADTAANDYSKAQDIAMPDNWVGLGDSADYYKLTMVNAGKLTLNLSGLTGDANLTLLDANRKQLKASCNRGTTEESIAQMLLAGDYYVKVAPGTGVNDAFYNLTSKIDYVPTDTAANDYKTAKDINAGVDNWVGFGDAADVYKLTMTDAGTVTLGLTGLSGNADLSLLDSKGKVLKTSANKGTADESITQNLLAGTYYVKVAPGAGVNSAYYTLTDQISYYPGDTLDKAGNTIAAAKLVDASLPTQTGWVGFGDSDDYYRFDLATATQRTLRLDMTSGNADLLLYNAKGKLLQKAAHTGTTEDVITGNLAAGTYYARVNAVSGNSIAYTLEFDNKKAAAGMLAS